MEAEFAATQKSLPRSLSQSERRFAGRLSGRRNAYYAGLNLTQDARAFSNSVREQLVQELRQLNATLPSNDKVRMRWSGESRICITPFDPVSEPKGLAGLKAQCRDWATLSQNRTA